MEPQLVATSRSGFPRGTPGHRRHWQRRLEQCEFLFKDRMELRRYIGKLTNAHPCLTPHEAFLAIAETGGDLQFATQLLNQEPEFADELYEMSRVIDVDKYIALRPTPVLGPVSSARRKRTLSRRWTEALSSSSDRRSTHLLVEEIAQREDPAHNYFLSRQDKYTSSSGPGLPWHKENTKGVTVPFLGGDATILDSKGVNPGAGSTRKRRGLLFSLQKSLKPERMRTFSPNLRRGAGMLEGHSANTGDRLFAPVSISQNMFRDRMLDANQSAIPMASEAANISERLSILKTNASGVANLTGQLRANHIEETKDVEGVEGLIIHDASNARRSPLRRAIGKSVRGRLSRKHISKQARRRRSGVTLSK